MAVKFGDIDNSDAFERTVSVEKDGEYCGDIVQEKGRIDLYPHAPWVVRCICPGPLMKALFVRGMSLDEVKQRVTEQLS